MRNHSFFKIILITITTIFFVSCDKDFNTIGEDLIGNDQFGLESEVYDVISYNQKIGPVQSNNLPINPLGVYDDPVFGTTEASFVTQLALASENPVIGTNAEIVSVVMSIPYFSRVEKIDAATGDSTYALDSIYGNPAGKFKLSVYESGYFLRSLDPLTGFLEPQKYYTNQGSEFDDLIVESEALNDDPEKSQNDEFFFNAAEIKETTTVNGEETVTRTAPAMRLSLSKEYFKTKIIDAAKKSSGVDPGKLTTNDVFRDYFRGLYFKVEKIGSGSAGGMALLNFKGGTITIKYKEDSTITSGEKVEKSIVLNLTGNTVSLTSSQNATDYANATNPAVVDTVAGDPKLYVKGGEGAMAVLELFNRTDVRGFNDKGEPTVGPNNIPDELDDLKQLSATKKLLINEANLVFHVDAAAMGTAALPSRMYLYDFTNKRFLIDYFNDSASGFSIFGGILNATIPTAKTYKFRITDYISRLINNRDSTNVKLGLVVTGDIANTTMNKLRLPLPEEGATVSEVPQASVLSPFGIVLHGGASSVPEDKKLKLEIYYTKPN